MPRSPLARAARMLLRLAGWLITPVVLTLTAAIGATITALVAPRLSTTGALVLMAFGGLVGALLGLLAWEKLLGRSPELRAALAVTAEGVPEPLVVEDMIAESEASEVPPS
ncbi:MAG: hypothetical protein V4503_03660 [Gemmatimonadota bacterium]